MCVGGAYSSYFVKNPCENWVIKYDVLALNDAYVSVFNFLSRACGTRNYDHRVMRVKCSIIIRISISNFKILTKYKIWMMHLLSFKLNLLTVQVHPFCSSK